MPQEIVRLLELEPDLARFMAEEDRREAERVAVPVLRLPRGALALADVLARMGAFAGFVLDGLILQRMRLGNHVTMKVHGPGDIVSRVEGPGSMLISDWAMTAGEGVRLAVLGNEFLAAVRRWPALGAGLHVRSAEQTERVAVQLAICQLPRVDERLLALLWWLAEAWGRVTSVGTVVPLSMTHDVLGALVGARRPTVTLALGELAARGAIARQDQGWLLLAPPPQPGRPAPEFDDPAVIPPVGAVWREAAPPAESSAAAHAELLETVHRLRAEHEERRRQVRQRLLALSESRRALAARRGRQWQAVTPPRAPS